MSSTTILDRIEKLIAKAESTTSPQEAAVFMAKAEELMLKHSIDRARLVNSGKATKAEITFQVLDFSDTGLPKSYWPVLRDSAFEVGHATGLVGMSTVSSRMLMYVYGTRTDVENVTAILRSMWRQAPAHLKIWRKLDPDYNALSWDIPDEYNEKWACTISFLKGFGHGFARAIAETRQAVEKETAGAELVLVSRKAEIEAAMGNVRPGRFGNLKLGSSGYLAGRQAGYDAEKGNRISS